MMKSLAARCGLNIDSLAEHLFPLAGAFLVYANKRSQFTLGGLEYVFRRDLGRRPHRAHRRDTLPVQPGLP